MTSTISERPLTQPSGVPGGSGKPSAPDSSAGRAVHVVVTWFDALTGAADALPPWRARVRHLAFAVVPLTARTSRPPRFGPGSAEAFACVNMLVVLLSPIAWKRPHRSAA